MAAVIESKRSLRSEVPDLIKCVLGAVLFYLGVDLHSGAVEWGNCFLATLCWICTGFYWTCLVSPATCKEIGHCVHFSATVIFFALVIHGVIFGADIGFMALLFASGLVSTWRLYRCYEPQRT